MDDGTVGSVMTQSPLYQRIAGYLRDLIEAGGELPSVSALARQYECTRPTVQKALGTLRREGLIGDDRKVIKSKPVTLRVSDEESLTFVTDLMAAGHVTEIPEISVDHRGGSIVRTVLRTVDGEPHNRAEWVFPLNLFAGTRLDYDTDIPGGSVRYVKEGLGWTGLVQEKWIEARMPTAAEAAVLGMSGGPVIVEHRTGGQDGTALFASARILRADRTRLVP
jgi:DNA-binding GntR family transcriptional regulator